MFELKYPSSDLPLLSRENLPTMYDLPSEDPKEPGLPDEFHILQPALLSATFHPPDYSREQIFTGTDLNLYYDRQHLQWQKRPDWFGVVGVPRLYEGKDLRLSYVIWQEQVVPYVIVELISPSTEKEDLGETQREAGSPPTKWEVYEQILRVPYYVIFNRYTNELRGFVNEGGKYQELELEERKIWMPGLKIGLGIWSGNYSGIGRQWLRWYDVRGKWLLTETEQERQEKERQRRAKERERRAKERERQAKEEAQNQALTERQRAQEAEARAEALAQKLRELGIDSE